MTMMQDFILAGVIVDGVIDFGHICYRVEKSFVKNVEKRSYREGPKKLISELCPTMGWVRVETPKLFLVKRFDI